MLPIGFESLGKQPKDLVKVIYRLRSQLFEPFWIHIAKIGREYLKHEFIILIPIWHSILVLSNTCEWIRLAIIDREFWGVIVLWNFHIHYLCKSGEVGKNKELLRFYSAFSFSCRANHILKSSFDFPSLRMWIYVSLTSHRGIHLHTLFLSAISFLWSLSVPIVFKFNLVKSCLQMHKAFFISSSFLSCRISRSFQTLIDFYL